MTMPKHLEAWTQQQLFPPNVLQVVIRLGIVSEPPHAQLQMEASDPSDGILLAMRAIPHMPTTDAADLLEMLEVLLADVLEACLNPEPF